MCEGKWVKLLFKELVVGDVVKFLSGDCIGVDFWIMEVKSLEIEELVFMGEFLFVVK